MLTSLSTSCFHLWAMYPTRVCFTLKLYLLPYALSSSTFVSLCLCVCLFWDRVYVSKMMELYFRLFCGLGYWAPATTEKTGVACAVQCSSWCSAGWAMHPPEPYPCSPQWRGTLDRLSLTCSKLVACAYCLAWPLGRQRYWSPGLKCGDYCMQNGPCCPGPCSCLSSWFFT